MLRLTGELMLGGLFLLLAGMPEGIRCFVTIFILKVPGVYGSSKPSIGLSFDDLEELLSR